MRLPAHRLRPGDLGSSPIAISLATPGKVSFKVVWTTLLRLPSRAILCWNGKKALRNALGLEISRASRTSPSMASS